MQSLPLIVHCFGVLLAQTGRLGAKFKKSPEHKQKGVREKKNEPPVDSEKILVSLCTHFHETPKFFFVFFWGGSSNLKDHFFGRSIGRKAVFSYIDMSYFPYKSS